MALSFKHKFFNISVSAFETLLKSISVDSYHKAVAEIMERLDTKVEVKTSAGPIYLTCTSETARIRAQNMLTREPDTLRWIEGFKPDEVLWDLGCNVGVFSLYAAIVAKSRVVSFDPLPFNYMEIFKNIVANGLSARVQPFCVAITDQTTIANLYLPLEAVTPGGAGGTFGQKQDGYGDEVQAVVEHSTLGYSVDDFVSKFNVPFPNHLKMDIDGPTDPVIRGAVNTLRDPRLRSAMLELQPTKVPANKIAWDTTMKEMEIAGFKLVKTVATTPDGGGNPVNDATNNFFIKE